MCETSHSFRGRWKDLTTAMTAGTVGHSKVPPREAAEKTKDSKKHGLRLRCDTTKKMQTRWRWIKSGGFGSYGNGGRVSKVANINRVQNRGRRDLK